MGKLILLLFLSAAGPSFIFCQSFSAADGAGTIEGSVTDPSGGVVVGAVRSAVPLTLNRSLQVSGRRTTDIVKEAQ